MSKKTPTLLTDNKLLIWLANIPEKHRWIGLASLLGGAIVLWAAFFYIPLLWRIESDRSEVEQGEKLQESLEKQAKKSLLLKKENEEMKDFLQNSVVPQSYQIADSLVTLANKSGIVCSSIAPISGEQDATSCYKVGMKGQFTKVLQFLDQLQRLPAVSGIRNFSCDRTKNSLVEATLLLEVMGRKV